MAAQTKTTNPWFAAAVARAQTTYVGTDTLDYEVAATRDEYARHGEGQSRPCKCGRRLYWKATIGAYKCFCGAIQTEAGNFI